ncbi:T6D22.12 isoform 3 [Hibiscus syriacus]|uniref:T6D22.12 isoform 3 n=1 Tax=Hibiscus syriacus TaxID=106335 RepID=A0A6A3CSV8_HIBSY|nr:T6D22.12 isoform 3 [Hibiscus syriacus]
MDGGVGGSIGGMDGDIVSPIGVLKRTRESALFVFTTILGLLVGFLIGISLPFFSRYINYLPSSHRSSAEAAVSNDHVFFAVKSPKTAAGNITPPPPMVTSYIIRVFQHLKRIHRNPRVARLPPRIVVPKSDLFLHRLWGLPTLDLKRKPKYLATFSVGIDQINNIDACVRKFSEDFQILIFHYDGRTNEWDRFKWSKRAIHVSVKQQTKWWYEKRFLHPVVVSAYEYIFIWDENLGVEHFNALRYIELVKKHGLEISQPGVDPDDGLTWQMTKRRDDLEVHKVTTEIPGWCLDQHFPPCAAYAPSLALPLMHFYIGAFNIVKYAYGFHGICFKTCNRSSHKMLNKALCCYRMIWCMDGDWTLLSEDALILASYKSFLFLGITKYGKCRRRGVRKRCKMEWSMFLNRLASADEAYNAQSRAG